MSTVICEVKRIEGFGEMLFKEGTPWMPVLRMSETNLGECSKIIRRNRMIDVLEGLGAFVIGGLFFWGTLQIVEVLHLAPASWMQGVAPGMLILLFFAALLDKGRRSRITEEEIRPFLPPSVASISLSSIAVPNTEIPRSAKFFLLPPETQKIKLRW